MTTRAVPARLENGPAAARAAQATMPSGRDTARRVGSPTPTARLSGLLT